MGAWIEIYTLVTPTQYLHHVAPFVGAWIEISEFRKVTFYNYVAPFVGAWIEIFYMRWLMMIKSNIIDDKTSKTIFQERMNAESLTAKTDEQKRLSKERMSKIINNRRRTLRGCVDWNISTNRAFVIIRLSHPSWVLGLKWVDIDTSKAYIFIQVNRCFFNASDSHNYL